jgi:hypothetical protein
MIKEAFEYFKSFVPATTSDGKPGYILSDRTLNEYDKRKALPAGVNVTTLSALVDLIACKLNDLDPENAIVQVVDHTSVGLGTRVCDEFGRRTSYVGANLPKLEGFNFGKQYAHNEFLIALASQFTASGDRDYLLRIAANLTNEKVVTSEDDGITQKVGLKKGAALKTTEVLKSRVSLAPFRTFREVEQPVSEFIFRVEQDEDDGMPTLALFEADGGKWRIDAALAVRNWLSGKCGGIPVVA